MPFFSVVVPTFNRAALIEATLRSVEAQRDFDLGELEIIVSDDGSTDDTLQVVRDFAAHSTVTLRIVEGPNGGPGAARNRGMAQANGRYLVFLDSDDLWFEWTARHLRQAIEATNSPAFLFGEPHAFKDSEPTISEPELKFERFDDYFSWGTRWDWFGASAFAVRRDVAANASWADVPVNAEDIDFSMQLGVAEGFVKISSPTFAYREHEANTVSNLARTIAGANFLLDGEASGRYPGGRQRARERQRMLTRHLRPVCLECLRRGERAAGAQIYRRIFAWNLRQNRWRFLLAFAALILAKRG